MKMVALDNLFFLRVLFGRLIGLFGLHETCLHSGRFETIRAAGVGDAAVIECDNVASTRCTELYVMRNEDDHSPKHKFAFQAVLVQVVRGMGVD